MSHQRDVRPTPSWVDEFVARAEAELEKLQTARASLMEDLAAVNEEAKRTERFIRSAAPTAKPRAKARPAKSKVAPSAMLRAADTIVDQFSDREFTAQELERALGASKGYAYGLLGGLREIEFVAATKRERVNGAPAPTQFYRLLDELAVEELRRSVTDAD